MSEHVDLATVDFQPTRDSGIFEGTAIEGMAWIILQMSKVQLVAFIARQPADATMELINTIGDEMRVATGPVADMFKAAFARLCVAGFAVAALNDGGRP